MSERQDLVDRGRGGTAGAHPPAPIEDIILRHDRRGMRTLRDLLSPTYCADAATFLDAHRGPVLILTGFYVAGTAETDGPPGALALADAVTVLGGRPVLVSDRYGAPLLRALAPDAEVVEFPILDARASEHEAKALIARYRPGLAIAVERCGATAEGRYLNMRGVDISVHTARLDPLLRALPSIAIGDGGNELGMGSIAAALTERLGMRDPCRTGADRLVIAATSNWGAYGLLAALSRRHGRCLLPTAAEEYARLLCLVEAGAVSGVTHRREPEVDGFPPPVLASMLDDMHQWVTITTETQRHREVREV